jgi:hypothetical protein
MIYDEKNISDGGKLMPLDKKPATLWTDTN